MFFPTPTRSYLRIVAIALVWCSTGVRSASSAEPDFAPAGDWFAKKIAPVLKRHCYECHSAESEELKGELRLDTLEGLRQGGPNGPLVRPGDLKNSFLLRVLRYEEDDYQMPPRGKLSDAVIRDFETWVRQGAELPR